MELLRNSSSVSNLSSVLASLQRDLSPQGATPHQLEVTMQLYHAFVDPWQCVYEALLLSRCISGHAAACAGCGGHAGTGWQARRAFTTRMCLPAGVLGLGLHVAGSCGFVAAASRIAALALIAKHADPFRK